MSNCRNPFNRAGFSLVEALITLIITSVLIAGATALFVQNQRVSTAQISLAMLRSNLRFATDVMTDDMRQIGMLIGMNWHIDGQELTIPLIRCTNSGAPTPIFSGGPSSFSYFPTYSANQSDCIQIMQVEVLDGVVLKKQPAGPSADLEVSQTDELNDGDICLITDTNLSPAGTYDIFEATNVQGPSASNPFTNVVHAPASAWNSPGGLSKVYPPGSIILKFHAWLYYIKPADPAKDNYPKLMRRDLNMSEEIVADYVEDLQVALGIDANSNNNVDAGEWVSTALDGITNAQLDQLRAVRISLIGRTPAVPEVMGGLQQGANDINYIRPAIAWADRPAGNDPEIETNRPYYREIYERTVFIRNLRPFTHQP